MLLAFGFFMVLKVFFYNEKVDGVEQCGDE